MTRHQVVCFNKTHLKCKAVQLLLSGFFYYRLSYLAKLVCRATSSHREGLHLEDHKADKKFAYKRAFYFWSLTDFITRKLTKYFKWAKGGSNETQKPLKMKRYVITSDVDSKKVAPTALLLSFTNSTTLPNG